MYILKAVAKWHIFSRTNLCVPKPLWISHHNFVFAQSSSCFILQWHLQQHYNCNEFCRTVCVFLLFSSKNWIYLFQNKCYLIVFQSEVRLAEDYDVYISKAQLDSILVNYTRSGSLLFRKLVRNYMLLRTNSLAYWLWLTLQPCGITGYLDFIKNTKI